MPARHFEISLLAFLIFSAGLLACSAQQASSEETGSDPALARFGLGKKHAAVSLGYGFGFRTGPKADRRMSRELGDVSLIEVIPRFGIGVTDPWFGDAWYRGNFELLFEGTLAFNANPRFGVAVGGGSTLRYNFLSGRRVVPFIDGNFGAAYLDFDLKGQRDGFNFNVGCGGGFHWFHSDRVTITPEIRYQHFSNAGLRSPNHGINDVLFLIGTSYFFD